MKNKAEARVGIRQLADGSLTISEIAARLQLDREHVDYVVRLEGLRFRRAAQRFDKERILALANGDLSVAQIAVALGYNPESLENWMRRHSDVPRRAPGPPRGERNPAWNGGHLIDRDGYVLARPPSGYRGRVRQTGYVLLHRLIAEQSLGRFLTTKEVVDHIDGNKLNNDPMNLRVYPSNGAHLAETLKGKVPKWSAAGYRNMKAAHRPKTDDARISTYRHAKQSGAVREQQILHARSVLPEDVLAPLRTERYISPTASLADPRTKRGRQREARK